jgi:hypothetical protein
MYAAAADAEKIAAFVPAHPDYVAKRGPSRPSPDQPEHPHWWPDRQYSRYDTAGKKSELPKTQRG